MVFWTNIYTMLFSWISFYPAIWVIGIAFVFWPFLFGLSVNHSKIRESSLISKSLFLVGLSEIVSIPVGVIYFGVGFDRILSALVNSLVWITSSILVSVKITGKEQTKIMQNLIRIALVQGAVVAIAKIVYPRVLPIPVFHKALQNFGSNVSAFSSNNVIYIDWLDGAAFRTHGIMANATWAGGFSALAIILIFKQQIQSNISVFKCLWKYILLGNVVYLSLSRSVFIAFVLSLFFGIISKLISKLSIQIKVAVVILISILSGLVMTLIALSGVFPKLLVAINQTRSGSLETRSAIYKETYKLIVAHPFPLLGYGIKPGGQDLVASLATHSTPLGLLFKGGIFGLICFLIFIFASFRHLFALKSHFGISIMSFITLWSLLEDLDGGHLIPLFLIIIFRMEFVKTMKPLHPNNS